MHGINMPKQTTVNSGPPNAPANNIPERNKLVGMINNPNDTGMHSKHRAKAE